MTTYTAQLTLEFFADDAEEARGLVTRIADEIIGDPDVVAIRATPARWVPERPAPFAERFPGAAA